jgi:ribosomal protein S18 acetylase RimI-like enzyme
MEAKFLIRPAAHTDIEQLAALFDLYRQFYAQPAGIDVARVFISERLTRQESVILVAQHESPSRLLGFTQLYPTFCSVSAAPIYVLYDLFVLPQSRRTGVGRALLRAAADHAATTDAVRLELATSKTNHAAQALYRSLGWIRDEAFVGIVWWLPTKSCPPPQPFPASQGRELQRARSHTAGIAGVFRWRCMRKRFGDVHDFVQRVGLRLQHEIGHLRDREPIFHRPAIARHHYDGHRIHQMPEVEIFVPFQTHTLNLLPLSVLDDALFHRCNAVDCLLTLRLGNHCFLRSEKVWNIPPSSC